MLLDVPYVRQIVGFIYLTFIPGFVVLRTFKLVKGGFFETFLFSVGLDIALLMFIGLLLSGLFPILGLASPLSMLPLLVTMNLVVLIPCLWVCIKGMNVTLNKIVLPYHLPLFIFIAFLGIVGSLVANNFGSNSLLLLMLAIIAGLVALGTIHKKFLPTNLYLLAILAITVALLFHSSLTTNFLVGYDIHSEYHAFKLTDNASYWDVTFSSSDDRINNAYAMLSTTILPTVYSKITDIDGTWLSKILYPLIFSLVPLVLYSLYSTRFKKEVAFLSIFFLVSNFTFFATEAVAAKQMVGEFFYALLFLVVLKEKMGAFERSFFFVVFTAGLVVSHYSLSYIFMFFILLAWLLPNLGHFFIRSVQKSTKITLSAVLIFFIIAFAWYIYTSSSSPFNTITARLERIYTNFLVDFFDPSARTATVWRGLGGGEAISLGHQIGRIIFYIAEFFIIVGVARMLLKKEYASFGRDYATISVLNLVLLVMAIVVPNFAKYLRMERFYQISLLFLAPFFVLGGETVFEFISKRRNKALALNLILIVLIPFFLFETGFIYEVTGDFSYSLPLSRYRMDRVSLYNRITDKKEVTAARWLSNHLNPSHSLVYGDYISSYIVLTSYGMMSEENLLVISNTTQFTGSANYIYLRGVNTREGIMRGRGDMWNLSDIFPMLDNQNKVYSNRDCEIFLVTTKTSSIIPQGQLPD